MNLLPKYLINWFSDKIIIQIESKPNSCENSDKIAFHDQWPYLSQNNPILIKIEIKSILKPNLIKIEMKLNLTQFWDEIQSNWAQIGQKWDKNKNNGFGID